MNDTRILEALQLQPLSEEEKASRHIIGRLYGPIATSRSGTRNGRKYNKSLWEKTLNDDLFKEKIKNKSLFLELGHPIGREETDMEKVCACIPEMPRIVDGDLYAYVDILDTNNGRLLKTLCDYGFVPGISSRGSGDVLPNNEVDPETFFLETWDIVQLPAVKDARLQIYEGLDAKQLKLRKALTESYAKASDEEKKNMKEALDSLNIELDGEGVCESADSDDYVEILPKPTEDQLREADESMSIEPDDDAEKAEEEASDLDKTTVAEKEASMVKDLKDALAEYDDETVLNFAPIEIDGEECPIEALDFDDSEEGSLTIKIAYRQETGDNIDDEAEEAENAEDDDAESAVGESPATIDEMPNEADDAGNEGVVENLKEAIRQKNLLEAENRSLKGEKAVSDAEAKTLKEELEKYRAAFARTSEVAAKAKAFEAETKRLNEQLDKQRTELEALKQSHAETLTESADRSRQQNKALKEQLVEARRERDEIEEKLSSQTKDFKAKLNEQKKLVANYKETCNEAVNHYVAYRASMLGVKPEDILGRLSDNYSLKDIDDACDETLNEGMRMKKLPYGLDKQARVKITEAKNKPTIASIKEGYKIDDSLLELAGLK